MPQITSQIRTMLHNATAVVSSSFQRNMKPQDIQHIAVHEFGLIAKSLKKGESYWTQKTKNSRSIRIMRISINAAGIVTEVKLAVSSIICDANVFMPIPFTNAALRQAIAAEMQSAINAGRSGSAA